MITYITAFIFYTLAMIGILLIGFVIYKKTFIMNKQDNKGIIQVLDSYPIGAKKTLMVVKVKEEKFLIASGAEHTTFLSKLEDDNKSQFLPNKKAIQRAIEEKPTPQEAKIEEMLLRHKEPRYFDTRKVNLNKPLNENVHLNKAQKQFKELYEQDETPINNKKETIETRREMIKKLLNDLDNNSQNYTTGDYNG